MKSFDNYLSIINWREFVCGWGAAFINTLTTFPINKLIFRQILHGVKPNDAFAQLHSEGIYFLYRGVLPSLCQKTISLSLMFGISEEVRRPLINSGCNPYLAKTLGGLSSGSAEAIFLPFERIQTLLTSERYHSVFKNFVHAFRIVGTDYGFKEYYRGLIPILHRNGLSSVTFFILREEVQQRIPKCESRIFTAISEFFSGAVIGAFVASLFYPFNVIKVAMQKKIGGEYENMFKVLIQLYYDRGGKIRHIYRGVYLNCIRAFISWGVIIMAYESLKAIVY